MACPICFFRDVYQNRLKRNTFGIDRFENKLERYQRYFLEDLGKMQSQAKCACVSIYSSSKMIEWTDSFLCTLQKSKNEIKIAFDSIISVYKDYISKSPKVAGDNLWKYLSDQGLLSNTESLHTCMKLLFRARPKNGFDIKIPSEYFHIPFSKRHLVKSQRFSVSGQPMLYFGSSVLTISKEMNLDLPKLAIAGFIPNYSKFYGTKLFSLRNQINDCIENSLPGICDGGCNISFFDTHIKPNVSTILNDLQQMIFMNICTFPTEKKGSFIPEYVIPQLLTTAILDHNYSGIVYPSTKDFSILDGQHRFSSHHLNIGIFIPYEDDSDVSNTIMSKFTILPNIYNESLSITLKDVLDKCKAITDNNKKSTNNNNDYIIPVCHMKLHIEYLANSMVDSTPYFDSETGKTELGIFFEMLKYLEKKVT
jgi:hypothetical protein